MSGQKKNHGFTFRYLTTADGAAGESSKVLVYLHGFPDNGNVWRRQCRHFAPLHQIIVSAPGLESAQGSAHEFCAKDLFQSFHSFVDELFHSHPNPSSLHYILIGHDMGGPYAAYLAQRLMEQGRKVKLVLSNSLSMGAFKKALKNKRQLAKSWYMLVFQLPVERFFLLSRHILKIAAHRKRPANSLDLELKGIAAYRYFARHFFTFENRPIGVKTLFIWGELDPFLERPSADFLMSEFLDFDMVFLDCGHWPMFERPKEFNCHLEKFI